MFIAEYAMWVLFKGEVFGEIFRRVLRRLVLFSFFISNASGLVGVLNVVQGQRMSTSWQERR